MLFWAPLSFTSPTVPLSQFSNDPNGHLSIGVQCPIDLDDRCSDWDDKSPWGRRLWEGTAAALFTFFFKTAWTAVFKFAFRTKSLYEVNKGRF